MKLLIMKTILLIAVFSSQSMAKSENSLPELKCVTGGFPTTSFLVYPKSETVEVRVINHNGLKYAPLYSGLMTLNDIDYLKRTGTFYEKLGDDFTVVFKKEKCKFESNKFYSCAKPEQFQQNNQAVDSAYFSTSESVDKIPDFEFTRQNVKMTFRQNNEDYTIEMSYYEGDCRIEISN